MKKTLFGLLSLTLIFASVSVWGGKRLSRRTRPAWGRGSGRDASLWI